MTQPIKRKTQYHSTVSRRDFMKMLGLGVAGAGALSLGVPPIAPFKSLDDMMSHTAGKRRLPFWVKEVDKPTVDIDWDNLNVFPHLGMTLFNPEVYGVEGWKAVQQSMIDNAKKYIKEGRPGFGIKDRALGDANAWGWAITSIAPNWTGPDVAPTDKWEHPVMFYTPEDYGVPRYEGTPEENAQMIRVAARLFGASDVGFLKIDEKIKKLLYGFIQFEDVEKGYQREDGVSVLPNKDLWIICAVIPQSLMMGQQTLQSNWASNSASAYARGDYYSNKMKVFLRGLGYQHYGGSSASVGRAVGMGVMAGLGEYCRASHLVSPFFGNMIRTVFQTVTDLPLAETKPINAGILNFCKTCKKCAKGCPAGAISMDDEPSWITSAPSWQSNGIKGYNYDAKKCYTHMFSTSPDCGACQTICPFNKMDKASIHEVIKAAIGTTPVANSLIAQLDDIFGYGLKDPVKDYSLWEMDPWDIPIFGLDNSRF